MAATEKQAAKQRFMDFLGQKNLRLTSQRQAISYTVFSTEEHFAAEQCLEWSRRRDKSVSRATVYRTLPLLTESGNDKPSRAKRICPADATIPAIARR